MKLLTDIKHTCKVRWRARQIRQTKAVRDMHMKMGTVRDREPDVVYSCWDCKCSMDAPRTPRNKPPIQCPRCDDTMDEDSSVDFRGGGRHG